MVTSLVIFVVFVMMIVILVIFLEVAVIPILLLVAMFLLVVHVFESLPQTDMLETKSKTFVNLTSCSSGSSIFITNSWTSLVISILLSLPYACALSCDDLSCRACVLCDLSFLSWNDLCDGLWSDDPCTSCHLCQNDPRKMDNENIIIIVFLTKVFKREFRKLSNMKPIHVAI